MRMPLAWRNGGMKRKKVQDDVKMGTRKRKPTNTTKIQGKT